MHGDTVEHGGEALLFLSIRKIPETTPGIIIVDRCFMSSPLCNHAVTITHNGNVSLL